MGALSKGLHKALPISEKSKLACLEFQYIDIILKLALLVFQTIDIILKLAGLEFQYIDIILKLAWLEFQYFNIQKITENNFSISVYRYSNIDIPNPDMNSQKKSLLQRNVLCNAHEVIIDIFRFILSNKFLNPHCRVLVAIARGALFLPRTYLLDSGFNQ